MLLVCSFFMQLVCMCVILAPYFSHNLCVWKDMRCKYGRQSQLKAEPVIRQLRLYGGGKQRGGD